MSKRIDDTGFGGLRLVQDPDQFCYGIDAVLLADFAAASGFRSGHAVDLGTGNGIVPLILCHKAPEARLTGIDIQADAVELALETRRINGLEDRLEFHNMDVCSVPSQMERGCADLVTCNPPYFAKGAGIRSSGSARSIARQETTAGVGEFVRAAAHLLRDRGQFCMIHRPHRLTDILCSCRANGLEPKEMRLVAPREGGVPNMVLLRCAKGGGRELKLLPTLNVYDKNQEYTDEILAMYEREK